MEDSLRKRDQATLSNAQQNGSAISAPVTPATTPTLPTSKGMREGVYCIPDWIRNHFGENSALEFVYIVIYIYKLIYKAP